MGAAIWSTDPDKFKEFPVRYFLEFFENHGFLNITDQPQWLVIKGGSRQYIKPLIQSFQDGIRTGSPVVSLRRHPDHVDVMAAGQPPEKFDQVIIATHSDQALALLDDPSEAEQHILGSIPYQQNDTVLHTDASVLPPQRRAWASWNYYNPREKAGKVAVTYYMNLLQSIEAEIPFCVTLNWPGRLDETKILRQLVYHHPVYDPRGLAARRQQPEINGVNRTYFCGAYWGYGFHEDGVNSALAVGRHFGRNLDNV
jgi:predicted NAD/FAD-binding protein